MTVNIKDYKDLKKAKLVYKDLLDVKQRLTTSITDLAPYRKYIPVMESISTLQNSLTLIDIHLGKFKRVIEKAND